VGKESSKISGMGNLKKMKDITKNVYWERNTKTRNNANIVGQVIPKTTTDRFPHDAVTVRYDRITSKFPSVGVYFLHKRYGSFYSKLIVSITPDKQLGGYTYSYNGYTKMPMREITDYCEYIQSEMQNM
jgi:hypothetical protein